MKKILITGSAGFIAFHLTLKLAQNGLEVFAIDDINDYYTTTLKIDRLRELGIKNPVDNVLVQSTLFTNLTFLKANLADKKTIENLPKDFNYVIHLAAQAGVRYSLINPDSYIERNISAFYNLLEFIKDKKLEHFIFASSSSVYGLNSEIPFNEDQKSDSPISLYAATKKSNELMAHTYSYLFNIPITGLRFFTVYGPWGRPDMMPFNIADSILNDKPINLYDNGELKRDYTYIDDIIESIYRMLKLSPTPNAQGVNFDILNIGNSNPIRNIEFITHFEKRLKKKAIINNVDAPKTELAVTCADVNKLELKIGYKPQISPEKGVNLFLDWYLKYHNYGLISA